MKKSLLCLLTAFVLTSFAFSCNTATNKNGSSSSNNEQYTDTVTVDADLAEDFTVSKVFSDDMVIQRNERLRVFGFADKSQNGKKIVADFMEMHSEGIIANGEWEIVFPHGVKESLNKDKQNILEVKSNSKTYSFKNILVGDVFMVIGQSNVAYTVSEHLNYLDAISKEQAKTKGASSTIDENAPIRINYNGLDQEVVGFVRGSSSVCKEPQSYSYKGWQKSTLNNIKSFSALGYYFAYNYLKLTNNKIPVGLIEINGNGQPIGTFLPNEVAEATESDVFDKSKGYYLAEGVNGEVPARYMYNEYTYPFEKYTISGIIWYQGESDLYPAQMNEYTTRFRMLMKHMRSTHNSDNANFPVYIVEFPTMYKKPLNYTGKDSWTYLDIGKIRGVIGAIPMRVANCYLSVSSDLWTDDTYFNNLHPNCKFEQSERLAKLVSAVNGEYGTLDQATGPILSSVSYGSDNKSAVLTFKNVGNGLATYDNSKTVKGFKALNGLNSPSYDCVATITDKNTVKITCEKEMKGVAYNVETTNFYGREINLCDSYGNPAGAFMINN